MASGAEETCDLLIVCSGTAQVQTFTQRILDCCSRVSPRKQLSIRELDSSPQDKTPVVAAKLLLLVSSETENYHTDIENWVSAVLERSLSPQFSLLIVREGSQTKPHGFQFWDGSNNSISSKVIDVASLTEVFRWWPEVLRFLYEPNSGRKSRAWKIQSHLNRVSPGRYGTKNAATGAQQKLKDDIDSIVSKFHTERKYYQLCVETKELVAVSFGENIAVPFYAHDRYRHTKINGGTVMFFFTKEVELNLTIKRLSTHRFFPGQFMEGISLIFCQLFCLEMTGQSMDVLRAPDGPLTLTNQGFSWPRLEQLGNRSLSLQQLDKTLGEWVEIETRLPLFHTAYPYRRSALDATTKYRLVQEDEDGQMSEPLCYRETRRQLIGRLSLAFLLTVLNLPSILLIVATFPFSLCIFLCIRARKSTLQSVTNLEKNSNTAMVLYWISCSLAFVVGAVGIILQHIYGSFHSVGFWFGLLTPFVMICVNYTVRGQFSKYAEKNLLTCTVPGYVIPPVDVCFVFWTVPFFSATGK